MSIPVSFECFALRLFETNKFLQPVHRKEDGGFRLQAAADGVAGNARTRFFSEPSQEHEGWKHIRNCYNNKYWVLVSHNGQQFLSEADEPDESTTLFMFLTDISFMSASPKTWIKIYMNGRVGNACISPPDDQIGCLQFNEDETTCFSSIYLSRDKELPKYVAFKGNDGKYLEVKDTKYIFPHEDDEVRGFKSHFDKELGNTFLNFDTKDIGNDGVFCTVTTMDDGTVSIKSNKAGSWAINWRNKYDWILPVEPQGYEFDPFARFYVTTAGDRCIALRNVRNLKFINRVETNYFSGVRNVDSLRANGDSITKSSQLVVEEPLISREISDLKFHLDRARIHGNSLVSLATTERKNVNAEEEPSKFSHDIKAEVVGTWETIVSSTTAEVKKFGISIGKIPFVIGAKVTLSREAASVKRKAESNGSSVVRTITQNITVPLGKTVKLDLVAMKASYDVPFSYKQKDVLTNGETIITLCEDGLYTGVNHYDFRMTMTEF